jgi:hypothetical protein
MPNPTKGESRDSFIKRFMGSKEAKGDYPDFKQRLAVAFSKWRNKQNVES